VNPEMPPEKIASLFEVAVDLALEKCLEDFGKVGATFIPVFPTKDIDSLGAK
jgi:hypothetical protein